MRVKLDENVPVEVAVDLQALGHDAETVHQERLTGMDDRDLLKRASGESRVFVTLDKGIANIREYPPAQYSGIVLLRPARLGRKSLRKFSRQRLPGVLTDDLTGRLVIVTDTLVRNR